MVNVIAIASSLTGSITSSINARNALVIRSRVIERDGSLVIARRAAEGLPTSAEIESATGINGGNLSRLLKSAEGSDLVALMRIPLSTSKGSTPTAATVQALAAWAADADVSTASKRTPKTDAPEGAEGEGETGSEPSKPDHAEEARDVPADVAAWLAASSSVKQLNARIAILSDVAAQARASFNVAA